MKYDSERLTPLMEAVPDSNHIPSVISVKYFVKIVKKIQAKHTKAISK